MTTCVACPDPVRGVPCDCGLCAACHGTDWGRRRCEAHAALIALSVDPPHPEAVYVLGGKCMRHYRGQWGTLCGSKKMPTRMESPDVYGLMVCGRCATHYLRPGLTQEALRSGVKRADAAGDPEVLVTYDECGAEWLAARVLELAADDELQERKARVVAAVRAGTYVGEPITAAGWAELEGDSHLGVVPGSGAGTADAAGAERSEPQDEAKKG